MPRFTSRRTTVLRTRESTFAQPPQSRTASAVVTRSDSTGQIRTHPDVFSQFRDLSGRRQTRQDGTNPLPKLNTRVRFPSSARRPVKRPSRRTDQQVTLDRCLPAARRAPRLYDAKQRKSAAGRQSNRLSAGSAAELVRSYRSESSLFDSRNVGKTFAVGRAKKQILTVDPARRRSTCPCQILEVHRIGEVTVSEIVNISLLHEDIDLI